MAFAPKALVDSPTRTPRSYGLFSVVINRENTSETRWNNGVEFSEVGCTSADAFGTQDCDSIVSRTFDTGQGLAEGTDFTVTASFDCSPVGYTVDDAQAVANARLITQEETQVEKALWTGGLTNSPNFSETTSTNTLTSTAVSAGVALGKVEQWLASHYGSKGIIHVTRAAATILIGVGYLVAQGQQLHTKLGTPVVAGGGYDNSGPDGKVPDDGTFWVYGTPAILMYRGDVQTVTSDSSAHLDRSNNDFMAIAERQYVLAYESCGPVAAEMSVGASNDGGGTVTKLSELEDVKIDGTPLDNTVLTFNSTSGKWEDTGTIPTSTSDLNNDSNFITSAQAPVQSVNTKTGDVVLNVDDLGDVSASAPADTAALTWNDTAGEWEATIP